MPRRYTTVRSKKQKRLQKRRTRILSGIGVVSTLSLLTSLILLTRLDALTIKAITIDPGPAVREDDIRKIVEESLDDAYVYVFPKRNTLIYPKKRIEARILDAFTRVENVTITKDGFEGLHVVVTERSPHALWCADTAQTNKRDDCFFVDSGGYSFAPAPEFSGDVFFIFYDDREQERVLGSFILSVEDFSLVAAFLQRLSTFGVEPVSLTIHDDYFSVTLERGFDIRIPATDTLDITLGNIESIINAGILDGEGLVQSPKEYIDFRFGNKIFYK